MHIPNYLRKYLKPFKRPLFKLYVLTFTVYGKIFNPLKKILNSSKKTRKLEIGPGEARVPGFETLNIVGGLNVDYVYDAAKKIPFKSGTFDVIYASHILEHIPWYQTKEVLAEWVRLLKPNGVIEIWVPDGLKICKEILNAENGLNSQISNDGWYRFNETKNPYIWANGRIFTYGDGTGNVNHHNWHRAIFTPNSLADIMMSVNLCEIGELSNEQVRGYSHGWIGLGMKGKKPSK